MRFTDQGNGFCLWLSARDTADWARKPGAAWPCSWLSGRRLFVAFDSGGLVDLQVDGGKGDQDCPVDELNAIVADFAGKRLGEGHPCHFVAVGQFV